MSEKMYPPLGDITSERKLAEQIVKDMNQELLERKANIAAINEEAKTEQGPNFVDIYGEMAKAMQRTYVVYRTCLNCGVKQNIEIPKGKLARDFKCPICEVSPREAE